MLMDTDRKIGRPTDSDLPDLPSLPEIAETLGRPLDTWAGDCHGISLAIVKAGLIPHARVARGFCAGIRSQHSWIVAPRYDDDGALVLGDCHAPNAAIVDPTLWTYRDNVDSLFVAYADQRGWHTPHGYGPPIMATGRPDYPVDEPVDLDADALAEFSDHAMWWHDEMFGPLDRHGWGQLAHMTVVDWPSDEFVAAMHRTPALSTLVPVDRVGMLTTYNPAGLYLHPDDATPDPRRGGEV
jgi:hypothetical protein